jgi:ATPase subunit of ABC transporter with duplicated ATPase domains
MVRQKASLRSRVEDENAEKSKKISQLQDFVARFSAGTRASQVQSRKNQLEKLKTEDLKRSNIARPFIKFEQKAPSGKQTLTIEKITKAWDGMTIIPAFSALITKGEKICVVGKNGVGKSTLLRMIAGAIEPDSGAVEWGHNANIGYMPQDHHGLIKKGTTVYGFLRDLDSKLGNEEISGLLGRMLFSGEERMKPTDTLSGGETVRTLLSMLMMRKDNVLILDEPTNHLDLESIAALAEGLRKYEGTVIIATHDQELLSEVATRIWAPRRGKEVVDFVGGFEDFLVKHADVAAQRR